MKTKKDTHARRLTARSADGNHGKLALAQPLSRREPFIMIATKDSNSAGAETIKQALFCRPHLGLIIMVCGADFVDAPAFNRAYWAELTVSEWQH
jgi:hypothetical protein